MKSRSGWLKHTQEYAKREKTTGRKYFRVHKNHESPDPKLKNQDSVSPLNRSDAKLHLNESISFTPKPLKNLPISYMKYEDTQSLAKELQKKDEELRILRNLFNENDRRLKSVERFKPSKDNLIGHNPSELSHAKETLKANIFPELKSNRNKSTTNCKNDSVLDLMMQSALMQPRYPKNRPKVFLTNPITGIPSSPILNSKFAY